jgi:hypothetical protein
MYKATGASSHMLCCDKCYCGLMYQVVRHYPACKTVALTCVLHMFAYIAHCIRQSAVEAIEAELRASCEAVVQASGHASVPPSSQRRPSGITRHIKTAPPTSNRAAQMSPKA